MFEATCAECDVSWEGTDTKSEHVAKALAVDESWGTPPYTEHPLCPECFIKWIHSWLMIGLEN